MSKRELQCKLREGVSHDFLESIQEYCDFYGFELVDEIVFCCNSIMASTNKLILEKDERNE